MNRPMFVGAILSALAGAAPLAAQQAVRDTTLLEPLVITTTRVPVAHSAPVAGTTILTGDELQARGIVNVAEALRLVPGASVAPSGSFGGTTSLFLRGGERDYVRVLIDGVPMNQPGGEIDFANITTDNVERIEVVRGPASVLYGSDAMSGVIQIFTRRGEGARTLNAAARGGGYGTREADASVVGGGERISWSAAGASRRTNGIHAFNNQHRNDVLSGALTLVPGSRAEVRLSARAQDGTFHYPTDYTGAPVDTNAFRSEQQLLLSIDARYRVANALEATLLLGAVESDIRNDDRPDVEDGDGYISRNEIGRQSVELRLNLYATPAAVISGGVEYAQQRDRNASSSIYQGTVYENAPQDPRRFNRAAYIQATGNAAERLSYSLGARVDRNGTFGDFITHRAAAGIRLLDRTFVRAAAGTAFKEPTIFENFGGGFVTGNPDLDPERSRNWEVGVEQRFFGNTMALSASWFDQRFRNMIEFVSLDGVSTYANLASARARGVEVEARGRPLPALEVTASYTTLSARAGGGNDAPGDRLLRRPSTMGAIAVDYLPGSRGSVGLTLSRTGERDDLDFAAWPAERVRLPAYTKIDLYGSVVVLRSPDRRETLWLTARVDNVMDTDYQSVFGFQTPGRLLLLGARVAMQR